MALRIILAYLLVPLMPPVVMLTCSGAWWRMSLGDWLGILMLYALIGFLAMLVLGTPMLILYQRQRWTGWGAFAVGGGLCAAITSAVFLHQSRDAYQLLYFTVLGILAGLLFRTILFGFRLGHPFLRSVNTAE